MESDLLGDDEPKDRTLIQIREHPWKKGGTNKSILVEGDTMEFFYRIDRLCKELDKNGMARIIFYK